LIGEFEGTIKVAPSDLHPRVFLNVLPEPVLFTLFSHHQLTIHLKTYFFFAVRREIDIFLCVTVTVAAGARVRVTPRVRV
jgi:hypothetical protein